MPLEISEIGIHIAVGGASPETPQKLPPGVPQQPAPGQAFPQLRMRQLVNACVRKAMANLRHREKS